MTTGDIGQRHGAAHHLRCSYQASWGWLLLALAVLADLASSGRVVGAGPGAGSSLILPESPASSSSSSSSLVPARSAVEDLFLSSNHHLPSHVSSSEDLPSDLRVTCDPECRFVHRPRVPARHQLSQQLSQQKQLPKWVEQLSRQTRSPGYLLRTRKSDRDAAELIGSRAGRSDKYLFRVRKDGGGNGEPQVRNRKGGYLFRTRKDMSSSSDESSPANSNKRGQYLFRTRKSQDYRKRQGGYLFRTKKDPNLSAEETTDSFESFKPRNLRSDMYLFRT